MYGHTFRIDISLRDDVTSDQLIKALTPLVDAGMVEKDALVRVLTKDIEGHSRGAQYEQDGFFIHRVKVRQKTHLSLETWGDVYDGYLQTATDIVEDLSALSDDSGVATLTDTDTPEVENATTHIPYGLSLADRVAKLVEARSFIDLDLKKAFPSDLGPEAMERINTLAMEVHESCEKRIVAFQNALSQEARSLVEKALASPLAGGATTLGEYLQRHKNQKREEEESDQESPGQTP